MALLETKEEKKSFTITVVIHVVILLLLFMFGLKYLDPPLEQGIAVNFGTTDFGSGEIQPTEPIQSSPTEATSEPESQPESEI
ncbi:MAG: cell envelope integrity protein TolA, partial [Flavobacteriales bacterium]|nr:cell envelope integrity protein TolA [Flavobacteriales bacterium]